MLYGIGIHWLENLNMDVTGGDVLQLAIILVSIGVVYGVTKTRQDAQEKRMDTLEAMINTQIQVDNSIKDVLTKLEVGQAAMTVEIKNLIHRLNAHGK
jgi:uncharacterized coiled-coil protein SlyX